MPAGTGRELVNWPVLPYPGEEPQCVGYCPDNCKWEQAEEIVDCKHLQEEYYEKNPEAKAEGCFQSKVAEEIAKAAPSKLNSSIEAFQKEVVEITTKSKTDGLEAFPELWKGLHSLSYYKAPAADGSPERHLQGVLQMAWTLDKQDILKMTMKTTRKMAVIPNLDGAYGGEACKRVTDQSRFRPH